MLTIKLTTQAKRDFKREMKGLHKDKLADDYKALVELLVSQQVLPARYDDHRYKAKGIKNNQNYWRCHLYPDLPIIYSYHDENTVKIHCINSHSNLD